MSSQSLKPGWKLVKFGDVVRQCKESVDRNNNSFDRYIEGGHMNSENIHIRRWGEFGSDYVGPAFHRIFRKGQVLYGSRRTYLKKVAVADFDGITANTTFICESRDQNTFMQELLPFLMLTDSFTEHSIRESKGSTNPYINWPDIAKYEFPLPPLEEQKRIAEILWAADEALEYNVSLKRTAQKLYLATIENLLFDKENKEVRVEQLANINRATLSESRTPKDFHFKYLDIGAVIAPKIIGELSSYSFSDAPSRARRVVEDYDILLSTVRPNLKSFVQVKELTEVVIASTGFAVLSPKTRVIGSILFHAFFSKRFADFCDAKVTGTNYPAISAKDISGFKVRIPNNDEDLIATAKTIDAIEDAISNIDFNISQLSVLKKALTKKTFSPYNQIK